MVNETYWAPRNSARVNGFVNDILSTHDPGEVHRSPCRTPPWIIECNFFSYIFVSYCCLYIFEFCIVLILGYWELPCSARKDSSWELNFKAVSVITTRNKLLHGNENRTLHREEEFKVSTEWSRFLWESWLHMFSEISPVKQKRWHDTHPALLHCDDVMIKYRSLRFGKLVKQISGVPT